MAYANPTFYILHAARVAGVSALSHDLVDDTGYPIARLVDGRIADVWRPSTLATVTIDLDRGAGSLDAIDRWIVPASHNLEGASAVELRAEAADPPTVAKFGPTTVAAGFASLAVTSTSERYVRLIVTGTASKWEIPELYLTAARTPTTGVSPRWERSPRSNVLATESESGAIFARVRSAQRRTYQFEHVNLTGTDLAIYEDLAALGPFEPFYFDPPDTNDAVVLMELTSDAIIRQTHPAPNGSLGPTYTVRLNMREVIA